MGRPMAAASRPRLARCPRSASLLRAGAGCEGPGARARRLGGVLRRATNEGGGEPGENLGRRRGTRREARPSCRQSAGAAKARSGCRCRGCVLCVVCVWGAVAQWQWQWQWQWPQPVCLCVCAVCMHGAWGVLCARVLCLCRLYVSLRQHLNLSGINI
jgi:hypothetical protein